MDGKRSKTHDQTTNSIPRAILDPDWCAHEAEGLSNLIFQEALIGEVQLHLPVSEQNESGGETRCLGHVIDFDLLAHWD